MYLFILTKIDNLIYLIKLFKIDYVSITKSYRLQKKHVKGKKKDNNIEISDSDEIIPVYFAKV